MNRRVFVMSARRTVNAGKIFCKITLCSQHARFALHIPDDISHHDAVNMYVIIDLSSVHVPEQLKHTTTATGNVGIYDHILSAQ